MGNVKTSCFNMFTRQKLQQGKVTTLYFKCAVTMNSNPYNKQELRISYKIIIIIDEKEKNFNYICFIMLSNIHNIEVFFFLEQLNGFMFYDSPGDFSPCQLWCPSGLGLRPSLVFYIH